MENNSSTKDFSDENDNDVLYEAYQRDLKSPNKIVNFITEGQNDPEGTKTSKIYYPLKENVAEKVEGVTLSNHRLDAIKKGTDGEKEFDVNIYDIQSEDDDHSKIKPEDLVRDLEANYPKVKFSKQIRKVLLLAASINLGTGRGITIRDLETQGIKKNNAEIILQRIKNSKIIIPLDDKIGKMNQYVLSNCIHILETQTKQQEDVKQEILPNDISLCLARELSDREYVYHNIHLETSLNYKKDYDLIRWPIPSEKNKQKVQTFKLEPRRNCTFTISPSGNVSISIECTLQPYKFHTARSLMNFFTSCGQILNLLQLSAINRTNVVPQVNDWCLAQFDYNKDLPVKELEDKLPKVISWSSKGVLKLEYLGTIFQIYCKAMPFLDECLRLEGHYNTKEKARLEDVVTKLANDENKHPFTTIEEMLLKRNQVINESSLK